jgi:urea transport system substrate-binding protein
MKDIKNENRKGISRRTFIRTAGTLAAAGMAGVFPKLSWGADEMPVGSLLDATGPINIYGTPMLDSTKMTIDLINENGGVLGKRLKLIQMDTQSNNALYTQYSSKMILEDKVAVLMGGITSASREAVRPVIDKFKQLYFYNEQYEGGVCDKYVFCTGVTPAQQIGKLMPWAIENYGPKFYTLAADYNYGHISADWAKVYAKKSNGQVLGEEFIPLDIVEFGSTLARIQESKPDFVFSLLVGGNHIAYYRQHAAAGLKDTIPIVSPTFGLGNEHVVLDPKEAEGIVVAYPYFQELDTPVNRKFVDVWHTRFGSDYPYVTDSANVVHIGWNLWAKAVNMAGTTEREKVTAALESGLEFDAPEGRVRMDPKSHHLIHTVHLAKVNDKRGYDIFKSFANVVPEETTAVCDLIADPNQHKQYTPNP